MAKSLKYLRTLVSISAVLISIINIYTNKMFNIVWLLLIILNGIGALEYYVGNKKIKASLWLATCIIMFLCFIKFITIN